MKEGVVFLWEIPTIYKVQSIGKNGHCDHVTICIFFPTIESVPDPCDTADRNGGGNRVRPSRNSNKRTQKPTPQEQGQKMQHEQSHAEGSDDKRIVVEVDCAISQDGQAGDEPIHEPSATNDIEANEITTAYI